MKLTSKNEVVIQAFSTYTDPQWSDFRKADSTEQAFEYTQGEPGLRVMERTVVTIAGDWTEVTS